MNELFAVAPRSFRSGDDLRYVLEKFGPFEGRYVAEFPGRWLKLVHEYASTLSPIEHQRVIRLLQQHRDNVLAASGRSYDGSKSWTHNAEAAQQSASPFFGVIGDLEEPGPFKTVSDLSADDFPSSRGLSAPGVCETYATAAKPLIARSPEVALVDPYLALDRPDCVSVIVELLQVASGTRCCRFILWARESVALRGTSIEKYRKSVSTALRGKVAIPGGVTAYLVDDADQMHRRWLVAKGGALVFDRGFQSFRDRRVVSIDVVDRGAHSELVDRFLSGKAPFPICHELHFD